MKPVAHRAAAAMLLCALLGCAACTGRAAEPAAGGGTVTPGTRSPAPERSEGTPVGPAPVTRPSSTPAPPVVTTSAPAPAAPARVEWPEEAVPHHGGRYWAVYLEVARPGTEQAELEAAHASARSLGYHAGLGSICEMGAVEALALDPGISYQAVSIFFESAGEAALFVDLYQPGVVGTAYVTALCMD